MAIRIRALGRHDVPELIQLCHEHAQFEKSHWVEREREAELAAMFLNSQDARCWVASGDGELAGFATATLERSTWDAGHFMHMDCIYLRPDYRDLGLGRVLMQRVMEAAIELKALNLQWQTPHWNEAAVRFYDRLGGTSTQKTRFTMTPEECLAAIAAAGGSDGE